MKTNKTIKRTILGKDYNFTIGEAQTGTTRNEINKALKHLTESMENGVTKQEQVSENTLIVFSDMNYKIEAFFYKDPPHGEITESEYFYTTV